jgi:hypothetical protein
MSVFGSPEYQKMSRGGGFQLKTCTEGSIDVAAMSGEVERSSVGRAARTTNPGTRGWGSYQD